MANDNSLLVRTPVFRMSFPTILKPRPYTDKKTGKKGKPTYGVEAMFEADALDKFELRNPDGWESGHKLVDLMAKVAKAEWPGIDIKEAIAEKDLGWPVMSGEKKKAKRERNDKDGAVYDGVALVANFKSNAESNDGDKLMPPQVFATRGGKVVELDRDNDADARLISKYFVGGYYARANIVIKAGEFNGRYITLYLNAIKFHKVGERIGGMAPEDRFDGVDGGATDIDATEGLDDEIPF